MNRGMAKDSSSTFWTEDQDDALLQGVELHGTNWRAICADQRLNLDKDLRNANELKTRFKSIISHYDSSSDDSDDAATSPKKPFSLSKKYHDKLRVLNMKQTDQRDLKSVLVELSDHRHLPLDEFLKESDALSLCQDFLTRSIENHRLAVHCGRILGLQLNSEFADSSTMQMLPFNSAVHRLKDTNGKNMDLGLKRSSSPSPTRKSTLKSTSAPNSPIAKRGRGRPRKQSSDETSKSPVAKRGRGRPRKDQSSDTPKSFEVIRYPTSPRKGDSSKATDTPKSPVAIRNVASPRNGDSSKATDSPTKSKSSHDRRNPILLSDDDEHLPSIITTTTSNTTIKSSEAATRKESTKVSIRSLVNDTSSSVDSENSLVREAQDASQQPPTCLVM